MKTALPWSWGFTKLQKQLNDNYSRKLSLSSQSSTAQMSQGRAPRFPRTGHIRSSSLLQQSQQLMKRKPMLPRINYIQNESIGGPVQSLLRTEQRVVGSDWTFPVNRMVPPLGQANPSWKTLCTMSYIHHHRVFSETNLPCVSLQPLVFLLGKTQREWYFYIQKWPVMAAYFLPKSSLGSSSKCHTRHRETFHYHCLGLLSLEKFKL